MRIKVLQINELEELKKKIEHTHQNMNSLSRNTVNIDHYLLLNQEHIICYDEKLEKVIDMDVSKIDSVTFSKNSRGTFIRTLIMEYTFQIDLDIIYQNQKYEFEIFKPDDLSNLFAMIEKYNISYDDICGVVELYKTYPDAYKRYKYLQYHFKDIAKKYHLDNPRQEV